MTAVASFDKLSDEDVSLRHWEMPFSNALILSLSKDAPSNCSVDQR
jgi:hypothetical protein